MKKGFTLLELIVVIIVLGVLASIALPQYFKVVERGRTAEAVSILGLLRSAQVRYYAQQSKFTNVLTQLDVDTTTVKYYTMAALAGAYVDATPIASALRNAVTRPSGIGAYTLSIQLGGTITCAPAGADCTSLGY